MTIQQMNPLLHADVLAAMGNVPEVHWLQGDDLCDCTFQRVGEWTNPYLGKTLRVRLCCIWGELYKQYPQFVQDIDAYYDLNRHEWVPEQREWDSTDSDMPLALWYRQEAIREGKPLQDVRDEADKSRRPRAVAESREDIVSQAEVDASLRKRLKLTGWL